MAVVIDKKIKVPLHYQIYLDLLKKIQTGVLKAEKNFLQKRNWKRCME